MSATERAREQPTSLEPLNFLTRNLRKYWPRKILGKPTLRERIAARMFVWWKRGRRDETTVLAMQREQSSATERREREQISITLDAEMRERLESAARAEHRTLSGQVRHVLAHALESKKENSHEQL